MAENSKIEWTTHTFNPWIGCTKVGPGCDNCYAERLMDHRLGRVQWGSDTRSRTNTANWRKPEGWNKKARGARPRVFCASLADVFDNAVPESWRTDLWKLIQRTPNLDWLLLTKRVSNVHRMLPTFMKPWPNLWIGVTVVTQAEAERDVPRLMDIPATVHFLSMEPLIESVDLSYGPKPDWVIVGGESGPHARPMRESWAVDVADYCHHAGVPFFFKQGSQANWPHWKEFDRWRDELRVRQFPV